MLIGRKHETETLRKYHESNESEFLVVYGRRRVGKTYLVRQYFKDNFFFYATGVAPEDSEKTRFRINMECFGKNLNQYGIDQSGTPATWMEAFDRLKDGIITCGSDVKKTIFLDEVPWMETQKSCFLKSLEYFWNSFASARTDILLIVCGSTSAWFTRKLFNSKGGLHNRITGRLLLQQFTLNECEQYFRSRGIVIDRKDIAAARCMARICI